MLNKRPAARKCPSQSAAALHFAGMRSQSQCAFYQSSELDSLESRGCAVSRVRADRAVLHVLISIDISHRVFSHASTEVSLIFILSHVYYVDKAPATVCDPCQSNNTGLPDRLGEGEEYLSPHSIGVEPGGTA